MSRVPSVFNLWGNPIFRRYCRSRLRAGALAPLIFIVIICAAFVFLTPYLYVLTKEAAQTWTSARAARLAVWAIFPLQAVLLMLLGTGSVASGVSQEADDGMIDYQRLTPMSPAAKIVGYLFGLPVREYVLFLATMPFLVYAAWEGELSAWTLGRYYIVFLSSAILYHLVGLVTGMVFKRLRAGMVAQLLVVVLYVVIPNLSFFGFGAFRYFTVIPEFFKDLGPSLIADSGRATGRVALLMQQPGPVFFGIEFSVTTFSLLVQGGLIGAFCLVLWRKWRRSENHLLGKPAAVLGMGWVALLLLGSSLPQIFSGSIFPFESARKALEEQAKKIKEEEQKYMQKAAEGGKDPFVFFNSRDGRRNEEARKALNRELGRLVPQRKQILFQAVLVSGFFGFLCFAAGLVFASIISPTWHEFQAGLRRAKKEGRKRSLPWTDEAGAFFWTLLIGGIGAGAWIWFCRELYESRWLRAPMEASAEVKLAAVLLLPLICYQTMVEQFGRGRALLAAFSLWVLPIFAGILCIIVKRPDWGTHCLSFSALLLPLTAQIDVAELLESADLAKWPAPAAVDTALLIYCLLAAGLVYLRVRSIATARREVFSSPSIAGE